MDDATAETEPPVPPPARLRAVRDDEPVAVGPHRRPDGAAGGAASPAPGLRERKKRRTYDTIARCALELAERQGFRATTIAQIAEAADVSPRTVSAYFPVKEELLFPYSAQVAERLAERMRERPEGELAVDALRAFVDELFEDLAGDHEHKRERVRRAVIDGDESLRAYERHVMARMEGIMRGGIARDLGVPDEDVAAQLATSAAMGALMAMGRIHEESDADGADPVAHRRAALALLDQAIVFLRGGIAELRAHRGEEPLVSEASGDAPAGAAATPG